MLEICFHCRILQVRNKSAPAKRHDLRIILMRLFFLSFVSVLGLVNAAQAGPFDNIAIPASDIRAWANEVVSFQPTTSGSAVGTESNALGRADSTFVSLGELDASQIAQQDAPGSITLSLPFAITNGQGWDFAVFENAGNFFTEPVFFAELAYVEVSSNGTDFVRFPSTSLNVEPGTGTPDTCLLYTSPSPRDKRQSRMPSSA